MVVLELMSIQESYVLVHEFAMVVLQLMSIQESYVLVHYHIFIKLFMLFNVNRFN